MCLASLLLWTPRQFWGKVILSVLSVFLVILSMTPITRLIANPLEAYFPALEVLPEQIDGIIVLGGAVNPKLSQARNQPALNDGAERMTVFVQLAKQYPDAKLVFSGGSSALLGSHLSEAEVARSFLDPFGIAERVLFENQSRDTYENAVLSKRLAQPNPQETWLLVTTALHMPRAVGVFDKVGWEVVPYPVDYLTSGDISLTFNKDVFKELLDFSRVSGEWLTLIAFWVLGRTQTLLPRQR